jgi:hypothetical protein
MKSLSSTVVFLGLAAAAMIAIASCATQRIPLNQNVEMFLGDPNASPQPKYVELKPNSEGKLHAALAKLKGHNGICEITYWDPPQPPDPDYCNKIHASIKTERVIKSAARKNAGTGNSATNDPNLMYRIASPYPSDISDVATLLNP